MTTDYKIVATDFVVCPRIYDSECE